MSAVGAADSAALVGSNFVVDHVVRGETIQTILTRAQHQVRKRPSKRTAWPGAQSMSYAEKPFSILEQFLE